jgi:hypothetical protein
MTFTSTDAVIEWLENRARQESNVAPVWRVLDEAAREIRRLRAERDEARRMVCSHEADLMEDMIEHAKHRGWDCFKDAAEPRSST